MSFSAFHGTAPHFLYYHCYRCPISLKLVPVFSFFTFSKIVGSTLPTCSNAFLMPPLFGFPVPVYSRFHRLGFSFLLWKQLLLCMYLRVEELRSYRA